MMALAGGLIALILGIIGIIVWWGYFLKALMAGVPIMLLLGRRTETGGPKPQGGNQRAEDGKTRRDGRNERQEVKRM